MFIQTQEENHQNCSAPGRPEPCVIGICRMFPFFFIYLKVKATLEHIIPELPNISLDTF
jgi:hypothetical protein